ncbi:MAG: hypothetical protein IKY70_07020 [Bacteroidales bacterium]|nr:hypothetical protein [Bacteroidales bacterium]
MKRVITEKKLYESPIVEIVEIAVEKGFATSGDQQEPSPWEDMINGGNYSY